jgi:hypothetical protein
MGEGQGAESSSRKTVSAGVVDDDVDRDYNAAKNVGLRLLALPSGERPDGLGHGQLVLKSGTLSVSDVSNVHSGLEFERESTDKPTPSKVGS